MKLHQYTSWAEVLGQGKTEGEAFKERSVLVILCIGEYYVSCPLRHQIKAVPVTSPQLDI